MFDPLLINLSALLALVPFTLASWRKLATTGPSFWLLILVAIAGAGSLLFLISSGGWRTDLSTSIWITVFACFFLFACVCALYRVARQLSSLVSLYMVILGVFAVIWSYAGESSPVISPALLSGWVVTHIIVSVSTYAFVTLAAVASLAAVLQERSLKAKQQTPAVIGLPSLADCDRLVMRMLLMGEVILALGLMTGMALQFEETNTLLPANHKTILSLTAFVVIGGLLIAHFRSGLRGRKAARVVLLGYLLLTLGYPGVKFVTDVLLAQ